MATHITAAPATDTVAATRSENPIVRRFRAMVLRWQTSSRIYAELSQMSPRELSDLGLTQSDIPDIVNGTYRRP